MILKSNFTICDVINFRLELIWHRYHIFLIFLVFNFFKFLTHSYRSSKSEEGGKSEFVPEIMIR